MTKYYDPVFGISLYYPSSWKRVGDREFKGDSGYLKLSDLPDYHSIRTAHVCDDYAYIHYPGKQIFVNSGTSSCVVLPQYYTPKVIGEAFGIFQYKSKAQDYHYFLLETTHQYFLKIYESVVRDEPPFVPYSSFSPTPQPLHRDTKVVDIDEIFIIEANLDEEHSDMGSWEDPLFSDRKHNKDLLYARTRGNRLSSYRYEHCGGGESINIGDSTLVVDYGIFGVEVRQDGNIIFTMMISPAPFSSVWAFCEWNGSWILETTDFVIQDGQILNHKLGYDQMFGWNILAGKPFYFFTQNGVVRIWYDGQVLPVKYDYVFHYGCCEGPSFYNPGCTDRKAFFFGVRDGIWYHVEILIKWPYE